MSLRTNFRKIVGIAVVCAGVMLLGTSPAAADVTLDIGEQWANCGDVGVKIPICLVNLEDEIGAVQFDLCESIDDCLVCVGCEMTERTTMFDCVVNELENGCCAVILFSKNPGGVINPGECDVVIIDYTLKDDPECCGECIEIDGENIVVSDQYGYQVPAILDDAGMICPFECGDIEPPASEPTNTCVIAGNNCTDDDDCAFIGICSMFGESCTTDQDCFFSWGETCEQGDSCHNANYDCGDGDVDIFDILEEVALILREHPADACQELRANVPTGTPPYCVAPDGRCSRTGSACDLAGGEPSCSSSQTCVPNITVADLMVIIDMALNRQDCCSYWYGGLIY